MPNYDDPETTKEWFEDHTELIAFARRLIGQGVTWKDGTRYRSEKLKKPHQVIAFFDKPYNWSDAYRAWKEVTT